MNESAPLAISLLLASFIAFGAVRARLLTTSGGLAAFVLGTLVLTVSWGWGALLTGWFISAALMSTAGKNRKMASVSQVVEKGNRRDAFQVLANGGVYLVAALLVILVTPHVAQRDQWNGLLSVAAAASLAAAGADTWATEVGTLFGSAPWSLRLRERVPAGTSGAITSTGTGALVLGAFVVAVLAAITTVIPFTVHAIAVTGAAGIAGALFDTVLGAWLQERRWCATCRMDTEQRVHICGSATDVRGGTAKLNNDVVNALCSLFGAVVATLLLLA